MKLRACAVAVLSMLTVAGAAWSKPPRATLASLALEELPMPDQSAAPRTIAKSALVPELSVEIKKPSGKRGKSSDYYESNGYITTTVAATAPDWCLSSSATTIRREKQHDKLVVQTQGKHSTTYLFHGERVAAEGNATYLFSRSYWLDANTGYLELARDRKVRLTRIASRPDAVDVYAFRSPRELALVITTPESAAMIGANGGIARLGCGLKRLSFPLSDQPDLALSFALGVAEKDPKPSEGFHASQAVPLADALRVSASISQTSRDPAPVVSVTIAPTNRTIRTQLEQHMPRWNEVLTSEEIARISQAQSRVK
jgi:hypothetical protein